MVLLNWATYQNVGGIERIAVTSTKDAISKRHRSSLTGTADAAGFYQRWCRHLIECRRSSLLTTRRHSMSHEKTLDDTVANMHLICNQWTLSKGIE
jgi:hypothetical protein